MKDIITKLYFYKSGSPEVQKELGGLISIAERTFERLELFEKFESGKINEVEYLEGIKQIKIRKALDEFPF